jgi:hypothetical protein
MKEKKVPSFIAEDYEIKKYNSVKLTEAKCPFCNSNQYRRLDMTPDGDYIFINCECKCGKEFEEKYALIEHIFEDHDANSN